MTKIGSEMLILQDRLAKQYKYKLLPNLVAKINMEKYISTLPVCFSGQVFEIENKPGFYIEGKNLELFTYNRIKVANRYNRIVIGHYGAFIEINPEDMCMENVIIKPGQEYRMQDEGFSSRVKYYWMTIKNSTDVKLYQQLKSVTYADYKAFKWYVSPFEILTEEDFRNENKIN